MEFERYIYAYLPEAFFMSFRSAFVLNFKFFYSCFLWDVMYFAKETERTRRQSLRILSSKLTLTSLSRSFVSGAQIIALYRLNIWVSCRSSSVIALMSIFFRCFPVSVVLQNNYSAKVNISWASSTTFLKPPLV